MHEPNLFQSMLEDTPEEDRAIRLWFALLFSFNSVERVLRRRLQRQFDTSLPRFDVLTALVTFPDGLTMSQLAAMLGVTKGNVTGVVRRLRDEQWVDQIQQSDDRRVQRVVITESGKVRWHDMRREYRAAVEDLLAELPAADAQALTGQLVALQALVDNAADSDDGLS
ncbi:MAG: MarR family transcriptional regulator [Gammaproteobacteria bacterium]|nr:MarR family transcriptional regulator [Gammaproteobacteria bacterium]